MTLLVYDEISLIRGAIREASSMPGTLEALEALNETIADWLLDEERVLSQTPLDRDDPAVAERLRIWTERLHVYERLESALVSRRVASPPAPLRRLPEAVELGLGLIA